MLHIDYLPAKITQAFFEEVCTHVWTGVSEWGIPQCWAMFWERSTLSTCEEVHMFADATVTSVTKTLIRFLFLLPTIFLIKRGRPVPLSHVAFVFVSKLLTHISCSLPKRKRSFPPSTFPAGNERASTSHPIQRHVRTYVKKRIHFSKVKLHTPWFAPLIQKKSTCKGKLPSVA